MAKPKAPKVPPTPSYRCDAAGNFTFTPKQMAEFIERHRWAVQQNEDK